MSLRKKFRVKPGHKVDLKDWDPSYTADMNKDKAESILHDNVQRLFKKQYWLYAEGQRAVLIILQGMDTSGKDGVVRHVMTGLNPQGCQVASFKAPTSEELSHDFLWRIHQRAPAKGNI